MFDLPEPGRAGDENHAIGRFDRLDDRLELLGLEADPIDVGDDFDVLSQGDLD